MAGETLRTAIQLLAEFPDNTAGLIDAINSRNAVVSEMGGIGFLEDDSASFNIPITAGNAQDINSLITPIPILASNFAFDLNGNQHWVEGYTAAGITVPAGVFRLLGLQTTMVLFKQGGGTSTYQFQYTRGGATFGNPIEWNLGTTNQLVVINEDVLYEPALNEAFSVQVLNQVGNDDLTVTDFRQQITGTLL